jgi:hypothetical protein
MARPQCDTHPLFLYLFIYLFIYLDQDLANWLSCEGGWLHLGETEPAPPPEHHAGWMVGGQKTLFVSSICPVANHI